MPATSWTMMLNFHLSVFILAQSLSLYSNQVAASVYVNPGPIPVTSKVPVLGWGLEQPEGLSCLLLQLLIYTCWQLGPDGPAQIKLT